jgi:hypothetical protein
MPTAREDLFFQCRAADECCDSAADVDVEIAQGDGGDAEDHAYGKRIVENWGASNARGDETTKTERLGLRNWKRRFDNLRKTFVDNLYGA